MAKKASRKRTPCVVVPASDNELARLQAEIDAKLKRLSQSEWLQDFRERWKAARAEEDNNAVFRKRIDRAIAIRDGLIPPPWRNTQDRNRIREKPRSATA